MRILLFLMVFLIMGALFIVSNNNLAMYKQENIVNFVDLYLTWINNLSSNLYSLTGDIIKLDWVPSS